MADQSRTKSHISYYVTAKSHFIYMDTQATLDEKYSHIPLLGWIYNKCQTQQSNYVKQ